MFNKPRVHVFKSKLTAWFYEPCDYFTAGYYAGESKLDKGLAIFAVLLTSWTCVALFLLARGDIGGFFFSATVVAGLVGNLLVPMWLFR